MAKLSKTSVLGALPSLVGRTAQGTPRLVTAPAIAARSGKTRAEVEAVLAANEARLLRDGRGRLNGLALVDPACRQGLVVRMSCIRASRYTHCVYREAGKEIGRFDLGINTGIGDSIAFAQELRRDGKVVCETVSDMTDDILRKVWREEGVIAEPKPEAPGPSPAQAGSGPPPLSRRNPPDQVRLRPVVRPDAGSRGRGAGSAAGGMIPGRRRSRRHRLSGWTASSGRNSSGTRPARATATCCSAPG